jgi:hypothetical protein
MKHRNTTNRTFRTAGATMIALLAISTAACGGSTTIDSAANDTAVEAEAPAADTAEESTSVDQAEQTSDTSDTASSQEAASDTSSSNSSSSSSSSSNSTSGGTSSVQSQGDEPAAEEPAAEEPAAEEPVAEEPMAEEEPVAEEPAEEPMAEEPAAEEPVAEEPAAEEPAAEEPVASVIAAEFLFTSPLDVEVRAELLGFESSNAKGIASVCMIQYNDYGNPIYRNGDPYRRNVPSVEVNGVRYPAVLIEGCAPSTANLGVYSKTWSVEGQRGVNNSVKSYLDIAIRADDGQVKLFCIDTTVRNAQFVERNVADFANRTSMGACRS